MWNWLHIFTHWHLILCFKHNMRILSVLTFNIRLIEKCWNHFKRKRLAQKSQNNSYFLLILFYIHLFIYKLGYIDENRYSLILHKNYCILTYKSKILTKNWLLEKDEVSLYASQILERKKLCVVSYLTSSCPALFTTATSKAMAHTQRIGDRRKYM